MIRLIPRLAGRASRRHREQPERVARPRCSRAGVTRATPGSLGIKFQALRRVHVSEFERGEIERLLGFHHSLIQPEAKGRSILGYLPRG